MEKAFTNGKMWNNGWQDPMGRDAHQGLERFLDKFHQPGVPSHTIITDPEYSVFLWFHNAIGSVIECPYLTSTYKPRLGGVAFHQSNGQFGSDSDKKGVNGGGESPVALPMCLDLTPFVRQAQLPDIKPKSATKITTLFGDTSAGSFSPYASDGSSEITLQILDTEYSILDAIFYPWMKDINSPWWYRPDMAYSEWATPYPMATLEVQRPRMRYTQGYPDIKDSRNDGNYSYYSYRFLGAKPISYSSFEVQGEGRSNLLRTLTFTCDMCLVDLLNDAHIYDNSVNLGVRKGFIFEDLPSIPSDEQDDSSQSQDDENQKELEQKEEDEEEARNEQDSNDNDIDNQENDEEPGQDESEDPQDLEVEQELWIKYNLGGYRNRDVLLAAGREMNVDSNVNVELENNILDSNASYFDEQPGIYEQDEEETPWDKYDEKENEFLDDVIQKDLIAIGREILEQSQSKVGLVESSGDSYQSVSIEFSPTKIPMIDSSSLDANGIKITRSSFDNQLQGSAADLVKHVVDEDLVDDYFGFDNYLTDKQQMKFKIPYMKNAYDLYKSTEGSIFKQDVPYVAFGVVGKQSQVEFGIFKNNMTFPFPLFQDAISRNQSRMNMKFDKIFSFVGGNDNTVDLNGIMNQCSFEIEQVQEFQGLCKRLNDEFCGLVEKFGDFLQLTNGIVENERVGQHIGNLIQRMLLRDTNVPTPFEVEFKLIDDNGGN